MATTETAIVPAQQANSDFPATRAETWTKNPLAFLTEKAAFDHLWRIATGYARSQLVPKQFQGKVDDCFIICQLAIRMEVDPFMLMQATYIVHGRPGFEAKLAISMLNASGKIKGTLKNTFSGDGDDYGCRAWCIDRETGERIEGPKVDWKMVKAEGWNKDKQLRDGSGTQKSKWNTMPDLMFVYRAATFLIRTNYPEVLMGIQTTDESEDVGPQSRQVEISNQDRIELLVSGQGEAEKQPEADNKTTLTVESQTVGEPPLDQTEPEKTGDEPGMDDADTVAQWKDDISNLQTLKECADARKMIPKNLSADSVNVIVSCLEMREAALKGSGTKVKQGSLV